MTSDVYWKGIRQKGRGCIGWFRSEEDEDVKSRG